MKQEKNEVFDIRDYLVENNYPNGLIAGVWQFEWHKSVLIIDIALFFCQIFVYISCVLYRTVV